MNYIYIVVRKYMEDGDEKFEFRPWGEDDASVCYIEESEALEYAEDLNNKAENGEEYTVKTVDLIQEEETWDV